MGKAVRLLHMSVAAVNVDGQDGAYEMDKTCLCCNCCPAPPDAGQGKMYDVSKYERWGLICTILQAHGCCDICSISQSAKKLGMRQLFLRRNVMIAIAVSFIVIMIVGQILTGIAMSPNYSYGAYGATGMYCNGPGIERIPCGESGMYVAGDVLTRVSEFFLWLFLSTCVYLVRGEMNRQLRADDSGCNCCLECLCSFFCFHLAAAEANFINKGYLSAGCCGEGEEDSSPKGEVPMS